MTRLLLWHRSVDDVLAERLARALRARGAAVQLTGAAEGDGSEAALPALVRDADAVAMLVGRGGRGSPPSPALADVLARAPALVPVLIGPQTSDDAAWPLITDRPSLVAACEVDVEHTAAALLALVGATAPPAGTWDGPPGRVPDAATAAAVSAVVAVAPRGFGVRPRQHHEYRFEQGDGRGVRRDSEDAEKELDVLLLNLGIDRRYAHACDLEPLLLDFVLHHHLNIAWYEGAIRRQQSEQRRFFVFSIVLLAAIPILAFGLTYALGGSRASAAVVAAQLTAVLAGLLGFQSALRSLFERRNVGTLFRKASSALKKAVWSFEDHWAACMPPEGDRVQVELFRANLRHAIRRARDVVADEEDAYYATHAGYPLLDLGALLTQSGSAAAGIVGRFGWRPLPGGDAAMGAASGGALGAGLGGALGSAVTPDLGARVEALRAKFAVLRANAGRTTDPVQQQIVEQEAAATQRELRDAEQALLAAAVRRLDVAT